MGRAARIATSRGVALRTVRVRPFQLVRLKIAHPGGTVQKMLDEQGIDYELVKEPTYPRGKRSIVIEHTGQHFLPAIEFEDGSWYREDSKEMAAVIGAGRLLEKAGQRAVP